MSFFTWLSSAIGHRPSAIGSGLRKPKAGSRRPSRFRPQLEALEERWLPSTTYIVNTLNPSGAGSLANAVALANGNPGSTILAYGKEVPEKPGAAVMVSGQIVARMTPEEFKATPKAGKP